MSGNKIQARIVVGVLLILFGALYLMYNYDIFYFPVDVITWQYFFIAFGLILLAVTRNKTAGTIFIAIGLFNLVPELWPLIFVIIGVFIIMKKRNFHYRDDRSAFNRDRAEENGKNTIDETNIFGGTNKIIHSDNFKGGSVLSLFGGSEINLANCKLAEGDNVLEVNFIFGGSTLIVPSDWKVETDVLAIFGGFGDKRRKDPSMVYDPSRTLIVKGFVLFGGGEIKN